MDEAAHGRGKEEDRVEKVTEPGCDTCYRKDTCPDAREDGLCVRWRREAPDRNPEKDPNVLWRKGEPSEFD